MNARKVLVTGATGSQIGPRAVFDSWCKLVFVIAPNHDGCSIRRRGQLATLMILSQFIPAIDAAHCDLPPAAKALNSTAAVSGLGRVLSGRRSFPRN